jgi:hypothetical protein
MPFFNRKKQSAWVAPAAPAAPSGQLFLSDNGIEAVCTSIGFPSGLLDNDTIIRYILPGCAAVFAKGDLVVRPSRPPGGQLGEWFGEHDITEGRFFDGLTRLCRNPGGEVAGPMEDLQRAVAALAARGVFGEGPLPLGGLKPTVPPLARIDGADVVFGGNFGQGEYREHLDDQVNLVLAIEPGIRVMHVIDQQVDLLTRPAFSYSYIFASDQPFACQFLANYLMLRADRQSSYIGMRDQMIEQGFVTLAEGDITASLDRFIELDRSLGDTHGRVDVAFFVGSRLPRLSQERARRILEGIHFLLRPGGGLLLGFPAEPREPGQLALEELNGAALMAGFTGHGSRIHLGSANLANPGLPVYSFHRKD